jgi:glucosamine--fructose-6-phosphate aminotransferase (isomerizing)
VDPAAFRADIEDKPRLLRALADTMAREDPWADLPPVRARRVLLLGMGSSRYAAEVVARRLRADGIDAVADYASVRRSSPAGPETLVVAVSAGGSSVETLRAVAPHQGVSPVVAITNVDDSALAEAADLVVPMGAGFEAGGVACRTFLHTLVLLLALAERVAAEPGRTPLDVLSLARRAADAIEYLVTGAAGWLDAVSRALTGPHGVYLLAPAERLSSAHQSALMIREGPRRPASPAETGDWSHVDVYLTKTLDYRAVLFPGSRYDGEALAWLRERQSTVVSVGRPVPGSAVAVRYPHDDDDDVALLTETTVVELVSAIWWAEGSA